MPLPLATVFADLPDPRMETANKLHKLVDILVIATCAVIGGVGLLCMLAGCASVVASVVMKYTTGPGMTANPLFLLGAVAGLIGVQFVSLGLMGEVLTRVYYESQGKRPYVVRERRNMERPLPSGRGSIAA